MTEQAKVPAIRFAGFTDPWEQRKASEVFQIVDDRGHPTLPVLSATQNQGMIYRDDSGRYIGHDESNEIGYKRVLPGDFVVHLRSFQGGFAHSQYEGITSPAYTVFRAKEPTSHSDRFWKHWFMSEHFIAGLSTVTYGIRDGRSISVDEFMNTFLAFPAVEEQAAISRLFDYLDDLITLHQRKYDKLVIFKKSMLEKMFPKDGESVPEIRFAGFTDPWEQRKLGEIVSIGAGAPPSAFSAGNFLYVKVDDLNESSHFQFDSAQRVDANTAVKPIRKGSIIFAKRGAAILGNKVRVLGKTAYIDTNMMALEPRGVDADFLWLFINQTGLYRIADTSTIPQINNKHIEPYPVDIPNMAEQQAIGTFFSRLDDLITLHQRKLELLQNIKKSLLDKMFV